MPRRIWTLLAAHVVVDVVLICMTCFRYFDIYFYGFRSVSSAQLCLLILWGGVGNSRWWWRIPLAILGIMCLGSVDGLADMMWMVKEGVIFELPSYYPLDSPRIDISPNASWNTFIAMSASELPRMAMTVIGLGLATFFMRLRKFRLNHFAQHELRPSATSLQFSIRQILLLTTIAAVVMAIGQQLHLHFAFLEPHDQTNLYYIMFDMIGSVANVTFSLLSVWAALGLQRPLWRVLAAVGIFAVVGLAYPFCLGLYNSYTLIPVLEGLTLISTLLVVRSCRYRLMRQTVEVEMQPVVAS